VIPLTRAISERIRGGYDDALYKSTSTLLYFTSTSNIYNYSQKLEQTSTHKSA